MLEEVLAWLLEAEEQLANMSAVDQTDVGLVREQFKEHQVTLPILKGIAWFFFAKFVSKL